MISIPDTAIFKLADTFVHLIKYNNKIPIIFSSKDLKTFFNLAFIVF